MIKYYWCENCDYRVAGEHELKKCPDCGSIDFRKTMSPIEARELGLLEEKI